LYVILVECTPWSTHSYLDACADITVFTTDGVVLLPETKIADVKFEGVEVIG